MRRIRAIVYLLLIRNPQISKTNKLNFKTFQRLMGGFEKGEGVVQFSQPESIAEVVYEAATDGKDQLRYLAGDDAKSTYGQRLTVGTKDFRKGVAAQFEL